jgi:sterol carrier protein 2
MHRKALIAGVGMTKFVKPRPGQLDYPQLTSVAIQACLNDAQLSYSDVQAAVCGFVYSESTSGNRACYEQGMTGIPIVNVNNNCSSGSTALYTAQQLVRFGVHDCVLALGFERMKPGR